MKQEDEEEKETDEEKKKMTRKVRFKVFKIENRIQAENKDAGSPSNFEG